MSNFVEFDEILDEELEFGFPEESEEEGLKPLPVQGVAGMTMAPYPLREGMELVADAGKLFDFTGSDLTPQQQMYILQFATRGTKTAAAKAAGVPYGVVMKWNEDPTFRACLNEALEMVTDTLEEELFRRAMTGSDTLMKEAMKAYKPERYARKETKDINVSGNVVHTWADLASEAAKTLKAPAVKVIDADFEEVTDGQDTSGPAPAVPGPAEHDGDPGGSVDDNGGGPESLLFLG